MSLNSQLTSNSYADDPGSDRFPYKRVVVKAGTGILTTGSSHQQLDLTVMADLVRQIAELKSFGSEVLFVTSGAIAAGHEALGFRPGSLDRDIPSRQTLAAVGQSRLMHTYGEMFQFRGLKVAQVLLTIRDLSDRQSYLNVGNTLNGLMERGVVPILNENDVVAVDEIGEVFGDNDRLSALVANLVDADLLVILTDTAGLYTADPNLHPEAELIPVVDQVDESVVALAGKDRNPWARGGMATKIDAARLVTTSGHYDGHVSRRRGKRSVAGSGEREHRHYLPSGRREDGSAKALDAGLRFPARRGIGRPGSGRRPWRRTTAAFCPRASPA